MVSKIQEGIIGFFDFNMIDFDLRERLFLR